MEFSNSNYYLIDEEMCLIKDVLVILKIHDKLGPHEKWFFHNVHYKKEEKYHRHFREVTNLIYPFD